MGWRVAVDVGGTFTDVVALNEDTGEEEVFKTSSTGDDPSRAFLAGIEGILASSELASDQVTMLFHGTTIATNAILEAKYARMGLIVTRGYRAMLECARQTIPGDFGDITWWIKPRRVVPLEFVREVEGRLDFRGSEIRPLDEDTIREFAAEFRELDISAIAISFLHSYRNPIHEQRARGIVLDEYPECFVSISSDVIREYREYERTLSTCLNTGLMPLLSSYVERIETRMGSAAVSAGLHIMKSSGGVSSANELIERPIAAVLSGPAAGVMAACATASAVGRTDVLTLDMGGTSTDIALIEGGAPRLLSEGKIDIYDIKVPMVDMTAVGAGGGSIAWLSGGKGLRVGPRSAGASPGPVCYGKGGADPTVTDANLVLGRISPYLLGGAIGLDRDAAHRAIKSMIAEPLELSVEKAADGILEIAVNNTAAGVRLVSVRRGRDPRRYALFAFGGAGGLHACMVADALGIQTILVPRSPGATSAEGLLFSDVRVDHIITDVQREDQFDIARLAEEFRQVREKVTADLGKEGFGPDRIRLETFVDMRYAQQAYEIRVPVRLQNGDVTAGTFAAAVTAFHSSHDDQYGYSYDGKELTEVVNVGMTGFGVLTRPALQQHRDSVSSDWAGALKYSRQMYDRATGAMIDCPVYDRLIVPTDEQLNGPAIIEQYDATLVVDPGWTVASNELGLLMLDRP
jgi:N-methylhydantoinase A